MQVRPQSTSQSRTDAATDAPVIPRGLAERIIAIGGRVEAEDVDTYRALREVEDRSLKLRTVLDAWERQQAGERVLRRSYAKRLLWAFFVQVVVINGAFWAIGLGWLEIDQWVANTFIVSVFAELVGLVVIIVKYLFPKVGAEVIDLLRQL